MASLDTLSPLPLLAVRFSSSIFVKPMPTSHRQSPSSTQAEKDLAAMRQTNVARREETAAGRVRAEQFQVELDRLGATLRQVEEYNEKVKSEIAVTRRATYAAEEAISKMEKEKKEQDLLIDQLQVRGAERAGGVEVLSMHCNES